MSLKHEWETFKRELPCLLPDHEGQFALIHENKVLGVYACAHDAMLVGYEKVGFERPFMVQQVLANTAPLVTLMDPRLFAEG